MYVHKRIIEYDYNRSNDIQMYGYIFSDDEDVVRLVAKVMPLVASFQVCKHPFGKPKFAA